MVHNVRSISSRTWITVGVIGIILLVGFAFVREYVRNIEIAMELERMEAEHSALNTQHMASLQLIAQLSTETAVEGESRSKLNLAKEGETLYVVEDEGSEGSARGSVGIEGSEGGEGNVSVADDPALSNPTKWFYYFFAPESVEDTGGV